MIEGCGGCRYAHAGEKGLECRRYPPKDVLEENAFPRVRSFAWCGEWEEGEQDTSDIPEMDEKWFRHAKTQLQAHGVLQYEVDPDDENFYILNLTVREPTGLNTHSAIARVVRRMAGDHPNGPRSKRLAAFAQRLVRKYNEPD